MMITMSMIHPYYVGVVEINWVTKSKFEVSVKLFTDDLQKAIYQNRKIKFQSMVKSDENKREIEVYVKSRLKILQQLPKKTSIIPLELIGWEIEEEATWIYFQCNNVKSIKSDKDISIQNQLLYNVLEKQVTIIHCTKNGERKSEQMIQPETSAHFRF